MIDRLARLVGNERSKHTRDFVAYQDVLDWWNTLVASVGTRFPMRQQGRRSETGSTFWIAREDLAIQNFDRVAAVVESH